MKHVRVFERDSIIVVPLCSDDDPRRRSRPPIASCRAFGLAGLSGTGAALASAEQREKATIGRSLFVS